MGPDDKTTEIELPTRRHTDAHRSNIVHVNFAQRATKERTGWIPPAVDAHTNASIRVGNFRPRPVDRISPWMVRVIALVAILLLSFLIL